MAEVKVIEVQIKSNIDGATTSVSKFKAGLKDATTQSKELGSTLQGSKQSEFIDKLGDGVGKLNPAFGAAVKGANGLILKMWEMVANPVGAILAGIVITAKFLYEAFQSSVAGGKELKATFAALSAIGTQVKDAIFGLGRALIDVTSAAYKFITLDFKGAAADMKKANEESTESFKQLGDAADGTTFKIIRNLERQQQANDKARKISAVEEAKTNLLLVKSRDILMDETTSIKDKKEALALVTKVETESSKERERIALKDLQIAKVRAKQLGGEEEKKAKAEIRDLEVAYYQAQTETAQNGIKLSKQRKQLLRQEVADIKDKNDKISESNKIKTDKEKANDKIAEDNEKAAQAILQSLETPAQKEQREYDERRAILIANHKDTELLDKAHKSALQKQDDDYAVYEYNQVAKEIDDAKIASDKKIAIEQQVADAKKAIQEATFNNISGGIGLLKGIFEKNKGIQKGLLIAESAVGIAKTIINTQAANAAFTLKYALLPGGQLLTSKAILQNNISAGIGIASNIAASAKGLSALGGGGGASGSAPSNSQGGGSAAPAFNVVGTSATNQLAQTIVQKEQQPLKAYVVAGDITTAQSLEKNIIQAESIG